MRIFLVENAIDKKTQNMKKIKNKCM